MIAILPRGNAVFENPLLWAALLLIVGLALLFLELFVPSGGMLGILAAVAIVGSVFMALFHKNTGQGVTFVVAEVIGVSVLIALVLRWWPDSKFGRRVVPELPNSQEVLPDNEQQQLLRQLVGKIGRARCLMLPSGAISIEGHTVNAVSEGMAIEAGQSVRVIEVRGSRVVVRPADQQSAGDKLASRRGSPQSSDDLLSKPIEELGLDPLDDPLA
jgi:membrane-bound serine protease (ClpP class)